MKVIILGANGYIGSELTKELKKHAEVYPVMRKGDGIIIDSETNEGYIRRLREVINEVEPDVIVNMVWGGSSGDARNDYELQNRFKNLASDIHKLCMSENIKYVTAGTISELSLEGPGVTEYAKSKAELLSELYDNDSEGNFLWLRLANVFGGNDITGRFAITTFNKLLNNQDVIINTTGEQKFNAIHIKDAIEYMIELIINNAKGVYLVGSSEPMTLKQFVLEAKQLSCSKSNVKFGDIVAPDFDEGVLSQHNKRIEPDIKRGINDCESNSL